MLGVAQPALSVVARRLERRQLIRYRRDAITVVDRPGLETAACECYRIVHDRNERLLARGLGSPGARS
jgi:hypothetical protein